MWGKRSGFDPEYDPENYSEPEYDHGSRQDYGSDYQDYEKSSSYSSKEADIYEMSGNLQWEVEQILKSSMPYHCYIDSVSSYCESNSISLTVHFSCKRDGFADDVQSAVKNAIRSAMREYGCNFDVKYFVVCDEIYE